MPEENRPNANGVPTDSETSQSVAVGLHFVQSRASERHTALRFEGPNRAESSAQRPTKGRATIR